MSKFVVACSDLLEAEGRLLRRESVRVAMLLIAATLTGVLALIGVLLLVFGLYLALSEPIGYAGAAIVLGLLIVILSGGAIWMIRQGSD